MQPGNDKIVAERIVTVLSQQRNPRSTSMPAPTVKVSGIWNVSVEYFTSKSEHKWIIEQDGNWIQGTHTSDFSQQELMGMVEGDQVTLRSNVRKPGDGVTYMFSGKVSGETIEGSIFLGEYLTAKFTARKSGYKMERKRIAIPGGPPLAT